MVHKKPIFLSTPRLQGLMFRELTDRVSHCTVLTNNLDPWSPGGSFMVQKMAITSPIPHLLKVKGEDDKT